MKKSLLITAITALGIMLCSFSNEPEKVEFKKEFIKSCMAELSDIDAKIAKDYCNCAATQLIEDFTVDQLIELGEKMDNGEIEEGELENYLKPCIDKMAKQLEDAQD